jgi:hypothetical protein
MSAPFSPTAADVPQAVLAGVACPQCGAAEFRTYWQTFADGSRHVRVDCARCKKFVRYAKQTADAPEHKHEPVAADVPAWRKAAPVPQDKWDWLGLIRQDDNAWRPVALAPTLARAWDALLHYPGQGDLLCVPTRPVPKENQENEKTPE